MRASLFLTGIVTAALATAQCSGGGGGSQNPAGPGGGGTTVTPPTVTISIVGTRGNGSYQPNPVPVTSGEQIAFLNNDTVAHRIVMDDGSADFGTLAPGQSSSARAIASGTFHCTTHPSMVGSINTAAPPDPPPGSGDGY